MQLDHSSHDLCRPDTRYGSVDIVPRTPIEGGSHVSLAIVYTAGLFGIDDTGAIRIAMRYATDMATPQFTEPDRPNYASAEASNGARLEVRFEPRGNRRPYDKTIMIRVLSGFLREGDTIVLRLGDQRFGSPGIRFQTAAEARFQFRIAVDAMAAGVYVDIPGVPALQVIAGAPARYVAVLPTIARVGERVKLGFRAEDKWGNPAPLSSEPLRLIWSEQTDSSLPTALVPLPVSLSAQIEFDAPETLGQFEVRIAAADGTAFAQSNIMVVVNRDQPLGLWGDIHGQSEETMGLNTAEAYFIFARDIAFLDVAAHQGIDFQITNEFYARLNRLTSQYNSPGRFVTLPGYEWAGNTGLGGDRNVFFKEETPAIYRSSHAVVSDTSDAHNDVHRAADLFAQLRTNHAGNALAVAHVGGRYADVTLAHDGTVEKSVEVHSTWGTFEWIAHDAFDAGYRVGIVCNSDDHKGRQGAAHPGASNFGAYGGLTCFAASECTRAAIFEAMEKRHHYGTTGVRIHLDVKARFETEIDIFERDPALGPARITRASTAVMGDIVRSKAANIELVVAAIGTTPIERIEIRSGKSVQTIFRPYEAQPASRRIRVVWEGAEYRGRGRQTNWDGWISLAGNGIERAEPINFINPEKKFDIQDGRIEWESITTGNAAGVDVILHDPSEGTISFRTASLDFDLPITDIAHEPNVFAAGGLGRKVTVQRLPERLTQRSAACSQRVELNQGTDTPLWVCVVQEDGHRAWSSPIYVIR